MIQAEAGTKRPRAARAKPVASPKGPPKAAASPTASEHNPRPIRLDPADTNPISAATAVNAAIAMSNQGKPEVLADPTDGDHDREIEVTVVGLSPINVCGCPIGRTRTRPDGSGEATTADLDPSALRPR